MTARPITRALSAALAAATLVLAACGADEEPDAGTAPSDPTPADSSPTEPAPTETEVSVTVEPESTKPAPPPTLAPSTDPTTPAVTDATAAPGAPVTGVPDVEDAAMAAMNDLADRIGVDPAAIAVATDEQVTWRDGSLGCPKPGMAYTQALVPGRRLILTNGGQAYAYHGARSGPLTYCETPDPNGPAPDGPGTDT